MRAGLKFFLVLLVGAFLWTASASGSTDPYLDQANSVPCPAAPAGWTNPPAEAGGRDVLTPLTILHDGQANLYSSAPVVDIDCQYRAADGRFLMVSVMYALPSDLNPWGDFYIGCTVTKHPEVISTAARAWNERDRQYRVLGSKSWSFATFVDPLRGLSAADEPRFEEIADTLLQGIQPFAHNCGLAGNGKPVAVTQVWAFLFDIQSTRGSLRESAAGGGSFITKEIAGNYDGGAITQVNAASFRLQLTRQGKKTRFATVHIVSPLRFVSRYSVTLTLRVAVVASDEPGCRVGSAGTLTLTQPYASDIKAKLGICNRVFLNGAHATTTGFIKTA